MVFQVAAPESGLGRGIETLGGVLGQALGQRAQRGRERQTGTYLRQALAQGQDYPSILAQAIEQGADPNVVKSFIPLLEQIIKKGPQATGIQPSEGELTHKALIESGYELPEYTPGTPASVYMEIAKSGPKPFAPETEQLKGALAVVQRQKELLKTGHIGTKLLAPLMGGRKSFSIFSPEGMRVRGEFEQLGKSLISFGATIPIRNRLEFEILSQKLFDPSLNSNVLSGTLQAMERIIQNSLPEKAKQKKESYQELPSLRKVKQGTQITQDVVNQIRKQVKTEKEGIELARKLGYAI